jgi:hypothetical protein
MDGLDALSNPAAQPDQAAPDAAPQQQAPAAPAPQPQVATSPHAGLASYIKTLALGVDSFATSAATQGREGGVQEVQAVQQRDAEMKLKQQAAQQQAQDHDLRMKTGVADYNMKQAQLASFITDMPLRHQQLSNEVQSETLKLLESKGVPLGKAVSMAEGQNQDAHVSAINTAANGDLTSNYAIPVYGPDGPKGAGGKTQVVPSNSVMGITLNSSDVGPSVAAMQRNVDQATVMLGANDPSVQKAKGQLDLVNKGLANGGTIGMPDWLQLSGTMNTELHAAMENKKDLTAFQDKQAQAKKTAQEADPLFKMENEPGEMSGEKSAAAIPLLQNKITAPTTSPEDKVRATRLLAQAKSAHALFQQDQISKANAEQAAKQGDPNQAGAMLANGSLTLTDMKTRGMTPKFIMDSTKAAQSIDPKYNPADEINAEAVAKSPSQNQFFGSANSLIAKGGTLDQVMAAGAKLPNHSLPVFNKLSDAVNYSSGHPEVAAYMQSALGAADDYAKVLGGGSGTEGMQLKILNGMTAALNQDQRKAVTDNMRQAVGSQIQERIGKNKFLMRQYGYALPQNQGGVPAFNPATDFKPIQPTQ